MNTLKYYMKIARRNKIMLILYIIILVTITTQQGATFESKYTKGEMNIGIIKNEESQFSDSLVSYLDKDNNIYYYNSVEDAELDLFTRYLDGIVEIPENSENILLNSEDPPIKAITDITNPESRILQTISSKYPMYYKSMVNNDSLDLNKLSEVLDEKAKVVFLNPQTSAELKFFGFSNTYGFVIMMVLLKLLGDLHLSFTRKNIQIRNSVSAKGQNRINLELGLAQVIISGLVFVIVVGISLVLFFPDMLNSHSLKYYLILLGTWTLVVVFFSLLANQFAKTKALSDMMSNALPVMLMFLSGSAIPTELMPKFVQGIARFSPLYYFNIGIKKLSVGNLDITNELLVILAFGVAFYVTSLYLVREQRKQFS